MTDNSSIHHRRSIRLRGYDYSQAGAYFVTICTQQQKCLFGDYLIGALSLNTAGLVVAEEWLKLCGNNAAIRLGTWVVMPNHFHGILIIDPVASEAPSPTGQRRNMTLSKLIGRFKMQSSKRINQLRQTPGQSMWQRNYWEHIIRDDADLQRIREYIHNNPTHWATDKLNHTRHP